MATFCETLVTNFHTVTCGGCGVVYAMSEKYYKEKVQTRTGFFCPNGCRRSFCGKTEEDRLRDEKARLVHELDQSHAYASNLLAAKEATERRLRGTRGVVTRMKNRTVKGQCVCCSQRFKDLKRHMVTAHPDWNPDKHAEALAAKSK